MHDVLLCILLACNPPSHPVASTHDLVFVRNEGHSRSVDFTQPDPNTGIMGASNGQGPRCLTEVTWNGHPILPLLNVGETLHLRIDEIGRHLVRVRSHSGNCPNFQASRFVDVAAPNQPVTITIKQQ